jgi:hypothetical protein
MKSEKAQIEMDRRCREWFTGTEIEEIEAEGKKYRRIGIKETKVGRRSDS